MYAAAIWFFTTASLLSCMIALWALMRANRAQKFIQAIDNAAADVFMNHKDALEAHKEAIAEISFRLNKIELKNGKNGQPEIQ